ncbi:hypothetical protein ACOMHN_012973 [Nucella lapillus]
METRCTPQTSRGGQSGRLIRVQSRGMQRERSAATRKPQGAGHKEGSITALPARAGPSHSRGGAGHQALKDREHPDLDCPVGDISQPPSQVISAPRHKPYKSIHRYKALS